MVCDRCDEQRCSSMVSRTEKKIGGLVVSARTPSDRSLLYFSPSRHCSTVYSLSIPRARNSFEFFKISFARRAANTAVRSMRMEWLKPRRVDRKLGKERNDRENACFNMGDDFFQLYVYTSFCVRVRMRGKEYA